MKHKIKKIDSKEFKAAVKQLKLGNMELADEFMKRITKCNSINKLNSCRMAYITSFVVMHPDKFDVDLPEADVHEIMLRGILLVLGDFLGLKVEEKS